MLRGAIIEKTQRVRPSGCHERRDTALRSHDFTSRVCVTEEMPPDLPHHRATRRSFSSLAPVPPGHRELPVLPPERSRAAARNTRREKTPARGYPTAQEKEKRKAGRKKENRVAGSCGSASKQPRDGGGAGARPPSSPRREPKPPLRLTTPPGAPAPSLAPGSQSRVFSAACAHKGVRQTGGACRRRCPGGGHAAG